jgi:hypothetical protein
MSDICPNYWNHCAAPFQRGEISKRKFNQLLRDYRCNYLPDKPEACVLRNCGMWGTTIHHDELVCAGCDLSLRKLNVPDPWPERTEFKRKEAANAAASAQPQSPPLHR